MSKEKFLLRAKIAERADNMNLLLFDRLSFMMDLEAADEKFNMRLEELANADDLNFIHDVVGIQKNINRETKDFNFFIPRFAKAE